MNKNEYRLPPRSGLRGIPAKSRRHYLERGIDSRQVSRLRVVRCSPPSLALVLMVARRNYPGLRVRRRQWISFHIRRRLVVTA